MSGEARKMKQIEAYFPSLNGEEMPPEMLHKISAEIVKGTPSAQHAVHYLLLLAANMAAANGCPRETFRQAAEGVGNVVFDYNEAVGHAEVTIQ